MVACQRARDWLYWAAVYYSAATLLPIEINLIMTTQPVHASLFSAIDMAPRDPILGITEAFNADQNPAKINLGVGVYYDDKGKVPLLACVQKAEKILMEQPAPRTYLPIDGLAAYDKAVQELVFGADS